MSVAKDKNGGDGHKGFAFITFQDKQVNTIPPKWISPQMSFTPDKINLEWNSPKIKVTLIQINSLNIYPLVNSNLPHFLLSQFYPEWHFPQMKFSPNKIYPGFFSHEKKVYTSQNIELIIDKWKLKQRDHPKTEEILI